LYLGREWIYLYFFILIYLKIINGAFKRIYRKFDLNGFNFRQFQIFRIGLMVRWWKWVNIFYFKLFLVFDSSLIFRDFKAFNKEFCESKKWGEKILVEFIGFSWEFLEKIWLEWIKIELKLIKITIKNLVIE
jgi:hypothetical protein